ncbi:MAG: SNF2-related protein [Christensenellales bacterium]
MDAGARPAAHGRHSGRRHGSGQTLQVITLLLWAKRRGDQNAASIVVAPTSLVYNWMAEIAKFAPELRCAAGEGTQAQRAQTISV